MHKLSTTRSKIGSDLLPSGIYLDLLKALPPLASNKCCVGLVLQIIQSLNKPGLQVIKLQLLYDLWAVENRCYPYLQRCLEQVEYDEIFYFYSYLHQAFTVNSEYWLFFLFSENHICGFPTCQSPYCLAGGDCPTRKAWWRFAQDHFGSSDRGFGRYDQWPPLYWF